jgi:hypothetical protein
MAYAADSLVEGFYDPDVYNPDEGKFIVGLQFHPERMRHQQDLAASNSASDTVFDYPGCPRAYQVHLCCFIWLLTPEKVSTIEAVFIWHFYN